MVEESRFRGLPSVEAVVQDVRFQQRDRALVTEIARETIARARSRITSGSAAPSPTELIDEVASGVEAALAMPLRPLINATGVIIHTNLGRAPLADEAIAAMAEVSRGYSNLEFDAGSGRRGSRHGILEPLLCRLTGAEAGMAVNNNASAVLLALAALTAGKAVVVSRGELVEIGGGFRIPDVMRQSRAKLLEVGTSNRTRAADYAEAIDARTAALMRVHPSNFKIVGFTERPSLVELADIARQNNILLLDDLGSGCLLDTSAFGLAAEPTPQESIRAGADVVMFSGDKLLGGPQGGLIVGRGAAIEKMKRHPLARAVRLDKASIAGLAATLRIYLEGRALEAIPVWRMIAMPVEEIVRRAESMRAGIGSGASLQDGRSMIGGGSLPEESLPSKLLALDGKRSAETVAARLREAGIVARIDEGRTLLDPRTIFPADDARIVEACRAAIS